MHPKTLRCYEMLEASYDAYLDGLISASLMGAVAAQMCEVIQTDIHHLLGQEVMVMFFMSQDGTIVHYDTITYDLNTHTSKDYCVGLLKFDRINILEVEGNVIKVLE